MEQYGLIGGQLSHSFSKPIHEALGGYAYALMPMPEDAVRRLFAERPFAALNVTIPYKQTVIPLCDEIDSRAAQIGAVNTVVNGFSAIIRILTAFYIWCGGLASIRRTSA